MSHEPESTPLGYAERVTWVGVVTALVATVVYAVIVLAQAGRPVGEIEWVWPMVLTIAGAIVVSIVASTVWGLLARRRAPGERDASDVRDREIEQLGERVGNAFLVFGALAALVLAMLRVDWFWIGQAIYAGFFLSAFLGGLARLGVYRRGF